MIFTLDLVDNSAPWVTGNIVAAVFQHDSSWELDPQLRNPGTIPRSCCYSCEIASTFSSSDTSRYRCSAAIDDHPPKSWIAFSRTPALSSRVAQVRRLLWVL